MRRLTLSLLAATVCASSAAARTPYLLPNAFDAERPRVTLQGAFTEDNYFNPDSALNVASLVQVTPSGEASEIKATAALKDVTLVEAPLDRPGTYRFSTGPVVVRRMTFANVGGQWLMVRQPRPGAPAGPPTVGPPHSIAEAEVPAGAATAITEQIQVVETYVSKGAPSEGALKTSGQGFELKPLTHPNAVYVDQGFGFQLLVDGKPAASAPVSVYRSGNIYDDRRIAAQLKTDAAGQARVGFAQPGIYLLTAQYPGRARASGETPPARTYTYSLTFEVTR